MSEMRELTILRGALETCAKTFRRYGELHRMKGTTEGNLKASNNDDLAEFCEGVLADTRTLSISDQEVEKVARAICGAECVGNQKPHDLMGVLFTPAGTEGTRPYRWETKIRAARAALLAIRQE